MLKFARPKGGKNTKQSRDETTPAIVEAIWYEQKLREALGYITEAHEHLITALEATADRLEAQPSLTPAESTAIAHRLHTMASLLGELLKISALKL